MKKLLLTLVVALCAGFAARAAEGLQGEVFAGFNVAGMTHYDSKFGFNVGGLAQYNFQNGVGTPYVNGGLVLSMKGGKNDGTTFRQDVTSFYFVIPIHGGYRYELNPTIAFFGDAGPYFGIGSFGNTSMSTRAHSVDTFGGHGPLNRFDFGLGFRLGVEVSRRVPISFGWDFGVVNVAKNNTGSAVRNSNFMFSVGYKF